MFWLKQLITVSYITWLLYLIVPFWYASAAYQASLVEPWFVFWLDCVSPKYPWRDQTSLICSRSVLKRFRLYLTLCWSHACQLRSAKCVDLLVLIPFWSSTLLSSYSFAFCSTRLFGVSFSKFSKSKFSEKCACGNSNSIVSGWMFQYSSANIAGERAQV